MVFDYLVRQLGLQPDQIKLAFQWAINTIKGYDARLKSIEDNQAKILSLLEKKGQTECQMIAIPETQIPM